MAKSELDQPIMEEVQSEAFEPEPQNKFMKKKDRRVEYKYVFGQKIRVDYFKKIEQEKLKQSEVIKKKDKSKNNYVFDIVYDWNGRA